MGRKKGFDKKSSITFKLVHRSQRDPLAADESAPQMVFLDVNEDQRKRREEQKKYGIYFDDDYNYLQHMRDVEPLPEWQQIEKPTESEPKKSEQKTVLQFPSSLFASAVEEKEGLLSKGVLPVGPQPDWDPEVVAAMDEDFDFDDPNNQIDDDFVLQAEDKGLDQLVAKDDSNDDNEWEDVSDSVGLDEEDVSTVCGSERSGNDANHEFSDEETKSHFTNYSMSSSVIRRNKNLTLLDQRFETLYESEYANDCSIGALDFDEIEGSIDPNNSELMASLVEEYQTAKHQKDIYENINSKEFYDLYKKRENNSKDSEDLTEIEIHENSKNAEIDRFDCESIISTYSNLYNRPKIIRENNKFPLRVTINEKTGLPIGVLDRPGLTAKKLAKLNQINSLENDCYTNGSKSVRSSASRLSELSLRQTNESPEQRRQRKAALKEYRRERRIDKKTNREAFKSENIRLNKEVINLKQNLNAIKLI